MRASRRPESSARSSASRGGLLKIGEVARRAGVPVATVKHYLREGLLPAATKTHRNMAYYPPAAVERIRLVKELQEKRFLPLRVIRTLVGPRSPRARAAFEELRGKLSEVAERALGGAGAPALDRAGALREAGVSAAELRDLERSGVISEPGAGGRYAPNDAGLLVVIGRLRRAGFTRGRGFGTDIVGMYKRAVDALAADEFAVFLSRAMKNVTADDAGPMVEAAIEGVAEMLRLLRRKALGQRIEDLRAF